MQRKIVPPRFCYGEKSQCLTRQLHGMSTIRTKFDEFCLIDRRYKDKVSPNGEDEVSEHCLLFDLTASIVPLHGTVQTELDSLASKRWRKKEREREREHELFVKTTPDSVCNSDKAKLIKLP